VTRQMAATCSSSIPHKSIIDPGWSIRRSFRLGEWSSSGQGIFSMGRGAEFTRLRYRDGKNLRGLHRLMAEWEAEQAASKKQRSARMK
jgi:hypothetical protein